MYEDYEAMCEAMTRVKKNIAKGGIPKVMCPMVFGVTGTGRVAQGALEVIEQLPHIKVPPSEIKAFVADPANKTMNKQVVICQFSSADMSRRIDGAEFNKTEYYASPEHYEGYFEDYLDSVTWLVHNIYWEAKYPRVLTRDGLAKA